MHGVFIFRRDFRIKDNVALIETLNKCDKVYLIFIFDPYQIDETNNNKNYRSINSIQFMIESLEDLNRELSNGLHCFYGDPLKILIKIKKQVDFKVVGFNEDYSPYSIERDNKIKKWCNNKNIELVTFEHDNVLIPYNKVMTNDGNPYTVFSSYYKKAKKFKVEKLKNTTKKNYIKKNIGGEVKLSAMKNKLIKKKENKELIKGGREEALKIMNNIKDFKAYNLKRDELNYDTTKLSSYLKFGCISIREVYFRFKKDLQLSSDLIKQLYWRSHYFVLKKYHSNDVGYDHLQERFKKLKWENKYGKQMWEGTTGFPAIDAGVRELNKTGFMHNRARLLVANFSVKILHLDPLGNKWSGQEYFSRTLIDCCYANNYGNWMWILGPYDPSGYRYGKKNTFSGRVFKDIIKFSKWDKELAYIRKWIPELKNVPDKDVKNWNTAYKKYPKIKYNPIVDFDDRIKKWYKLTKN